MAATRLNTWKREEIRDKIVKKALEKRRHDWQKQAEALVTAEFNARFKPAERKELAALVEKGWVDTATDWHIVAIGGVYFTVHGVALPRPANFKREVNVTDEKRAATAEQVAAAHAPLQQLPTKEAADETP